MGYKSSYDIERKTALQVIKSRLNELDNKSLAYILEEFKESYFRNYFVVDSFSDENEDTQIKSIEEF